MLRTSWPHASPRGAATSQASLGVLCTQLAGTSALAPGKRSRFWRGAGNAVVASEGMWEMWKPGWESSALFLSQEAVSYIESVCLGGEEVS